MGKILLCHVFLSSFGTSLPLENFGVISPWVVSGGSCTGSEARGLMCVKVLKLHTDTFSSLFDPSPVKMNNVSSVLT